MYYVRVLIAEDEEIIRKSLANKTKRFLPGASVYEAENGKQAQQIIFKEKPHIVITDIRMPNLSGLELMESCSGQKSCKFIITSGYSDFKYAQKAIDLKAVSYLLKPVENKELTRALEKALNELVSEGHAGDILQIPDNMPGGQEMQSDISLNAAAVGGPDTLPGMIAGSDKELQDGFISDCSIEAIIEKARSYIEKNFNKDITLTDMARRYNVSEGYFSRNFKNLAGASFSSFLVEKRIEKAKKLLELSDWSIMEISQAVGYDDIQYFYRVFKKDVRVTPREYRKRVNSADGVRDTASEKGC